LIKRLSLGYDGLIADIYWTATVQYFGRRHREDKGEQRYPLLAPLLETTTHLDPIFLSLTNLGRISWPPHRRTEQVNRSVRLIESGIQANPDSWRIYYNLGFLTALKK
jgi:hypothetical protein